MPDLFSSLLELSFRGISAPYDNLTDHGSQELAEHKRADRDGARQEATGRNPYTFSVKFCFINGIARARNETWDALYPQTYNKMVAALEDRSTGEFIHPERGPINVKPKSWSSSLTADVRGGRFLEVEFVETLDADEVLPAPSDFTTARVAAKDLEAMLANMSTPITLSLDGEGVGLGEFLDKVSSIADSASMFKDQILGKIDSFVSKVTGVADSFSALGDNLSGGFRLDAFGNNSIEIDPPNIPAEVDPVTGIQTEPARELNNGSARIVSLCDKVVSALLAIRASLLLKDERIALHTVQHPVTLAVLAQRLGNTVDDMILLNPHLLLRPVIRPGALARFYANATNP